MTSTPHPGTQEYRRQIIRITDLAVTEDVLQDVLFDNCQIVGPAVLAPLDDNSFVNCRFDAEGPDQLFWTVPASSPFVMGAIGLLRVEFFGCRFQRIGLAVAEVDYPKFAEGFGNGR